VDAQELPQVVVLSIHFYPNGAGLYLAPFFYTDSTDVKKNPLRLRASAVLSSPQRQSAENNH
jgi:hypothetical protein